MQINNTNNQNFTAIYKIPKTNIDTHLKIDQLIAPVYNRMTNKPICFFSGECPYDAYVAKVIDNDVSKSNLSYEWAILNAKNFNIKLPNPQETDVWIFTGDEDIKIIDKYTKEADKLCKISFFEKIIEILLGQARRQDIPEHLDRYTPLLNKLSLLTTKFQDAISGKNVIEVDSPEALFMKLLKE